MKERERQKRREGACVRAYVRWGRCMFVGVCVRACVCACVCVVLAYLRVSVHACVVQVVEGRCVPAGMQACICVCRIAYMCAHLPVCVRACVSMSECVREGSCVCVYVRAFLHVPISTVLTFCAVFVPHPSFATLTPLPGRTPDLTHASALISLYS